ncbi:replication initiation protein [Salinimonas sp. HHU 13199]|uniref:Replication initiation protein n=1 Tax=Salinimonas profundi TaxID=2729140 RepID=A0ABR8LSX5_9ALTE|nr:replication initiation protein [Salinimonas profundi]MBD3587255.1 replication initiation protein [Salinimonas profundi]
MKSIAVRGKTEVVPLRKHVAAVHIGSVGLSLMHRKSINAALWFAQREVRMASAGQLHDYLKEQEGTELNHTVSIHEFRQYVEYNSNDYDYLKSIWRELSQISIEFDLIEGKRSWEIMPILSYVKIHNGHITWRFPSEIRSALLDPEVYAKINSQITNQIQSDIAFALYENTIRYVDIGQTPWLKIDVLKNLLGVDKDAYKATKYFNRKLRQAIEQIKMVAGIELDMETTGRPIKSMRFFVRKAKQTDFLIEQDVLPEQSDIESKLAIIGFTKAQIRDIFNAFTNDHIEGKLKWLDKKFRTDDSIRNRAAFAFAAFKDGYEDNAARPKIKAEEAMPSLTASNGSLEKLKYDEFSPLLTSEEAGKIKELFHKSFKTSLNGLKKSSLADDTALKQFLEGDWEGHELVTKFRDFAEGYVFMRKELLQSLTERVNQS